MQDLQCRISSNQVIQQKNVNKRLFSSTGLFMDWKLQTNMTLTYYMVVLFYNLGHTKNTWNCGSLSVVLIQPVPFAMDKKRWKLIMHQWIIFRTAALAITDGKRQLPSMLPLKIKSLTANFCCWSFVYNSLWTFLYFVE